MAKNKNNKNKQQKTENISFFDKLVKNRLIIMLVSIFILFPLLFVVGFYTATYTTNKPNPFEDQDYKKSSLSYISNNKFKIDDFYLSQFYYEDTNGNPVDDGKITFKIDIGAIKDSNIVNNSVKIETYVCYNWVDFSSSRGYTTSTFSTTEKTYTITGFNLEFDRNPYLFVNVNGKNDARFLTAFTWTEKVNGVESEVIYVVENDIKDLVRADVTIFTK